jgi:hypothetical protein
MTNQFRPYRYGLDAKSVEWVEDVLSNDESSTNAELVEYFLKQGLSRLQAESVLRHREDYLLNLYRTGDGPLHST